MKKNILTGLLIAISFAAISQNNINTLSIIPQPASVVQGSGSFMLKNATVIEVVTNDTDAVRVASLLASKLRVATGYPFTVKQGGKKSASASAIRLSLLTDSSLGKEGYSVKVLPNSVAIAASKPAGLFYGMQTLLQLLPKEIESKEVVKNATWFLPVVSITDKPRFGWRGLMFDVSRHFFTKQDVKTFIDDMVRYKYNLLHLHLADD